MTTRGQFGKFQGMSSPRYLAAHLLMPDFIKMHGAAVLDAIERNDADFFIPVWLNAGFQFTPLLYHFNVAGLARYGVVTFPKPQLPTEAYLGVLASKPDHPMRYFTWEAATRLSPTGRTEISSVLGEWTAEGHTNHGSGPDHSGDFHADCREIMKLVMSLTLRRRPSSPTR